MRGPHRPSLGRQSQRLTPILQQLQASFDARSVEIQQTASGIDPEQVLVIETVGNITDFSNAVRKVSGLEWMGEIELEDIIPDEDFYKTEKPSASLSGRLYLVMTNSVALSQMLSLWQQYQANPDMTFERGLTKFRDVFLHLKDIRRWDITDRLAEKEVFEAWSEDLEYTPERAVRFEAELWFRKDEQKRQESESTLSQLINRLGGSILSQSTIASIGYHSILGEIPAIEAKKIMAHPDVDLLKCESVMFFRPTGQITTDKKSVEEDVVQDFTNGNHTLPVGNPLIAILDGLPLGNHTLLQDRVIIDDPENWESLYQAIDRQHGTAMASLIVHGDLSENSHPLNRPIYVRPIMQPVYSGSRMEHIPDDILFVDYIHRAVKRIMEGEGGEGALYPTIRIVNLSIGDTSRHFAQSISPLARLLDWLSLKYNILFVISSGNHTDPIDTGLTENEIRNLSPEELESLVVKTLYEDTRHRKILSPSESINALTVGSSHHDQCETYHLGYSLNVFTSDLPSPVSAFGSGYRRSIKPDLVYPGGKVLYSAPMGTGNTQISLEGRGGGPGNKVATPSSILGELSKTKFCSGSSNSAALISRLAAICYDSAANLFEENSPDVDFEKLSVPLLKAMLVHGCSWGGHGESLKYILQEAGDASVIKKLVARWMGYGLPEISKVLDCTPQRATLIGSGSLSDGDAHVFKLPLPPSLGAKVEWRKCTVTLSSICPVAPSTQRYRSAQLWFEVGEELATQRQEADWRAVRNGTIQHEIFEGQRAIAISDGDTLEIKVNCRKDAAKFTEAVIYALIVSLEVAEGVELPIYEEIRTRVAITPQVQVRPSN
ncbi:S8 family peptidase [Lentisphaera marina]|uniref:S8 family peptidase n=1 Tax=Lentisphaera marina TaxID=1111041 RepID=UPI002365F18A|nr:S8 family peptidase [Lentisphaera marina]MDD7984370.1 S8 family peptidase [Lentisphaera marina]